MIIADWLQIKQIQRKLGRKLTNDEIRGQRWIKLPDGLTARIKQIPLQWIHNKNNCQ